MSCSERIIRSEAYYDLIIDETQVGTIPYPACVLPISDRYRIGYYERKDLPPLSVTAYSYNAIPGAYCLTDREAMSICNILFLQEQPALELKGEGVLAGFVDTGINFTDPMFCSRDGKTKILAIWDQTARREGEEESEVSYGRVYDQDRIDQALASDAPLELVPQVDDIGHGTFLAGICCGEGNPAKGFAGAAPGAKIGVVKCKQMKNNLREYYHIPADTVCYQENDLMAGVAWLQKLATKKGMPLVICIGMGTGLGSHNGDGPLSQLLDDIGQNRGRAVAVSAGNEADARHHYEDQNFVPGQIREIELYVGDRVQGFVAELWALVPDLYQAGIRSPSGELFMPQTGGAGIPEYTFLFEGTKVSIEYEIPTGRNANLLIFFRFSRPTSGIWTILILPKTLLAGTCHLWLPMEQVLTGQVYFLRSTPDVTATPPAYTPSAICTGALNMSADSLYSRSGRGYSLTGKVKPDLAAPGVNVAGPDRYKNITAMTGTSVSAAITAGACAQLLEWGIVKGNYKTLNSVELQSILIRGAKRKNDQIYPDPGWGYGSLDVLGALDQLRNRI